jgi:hypothetical protein
LTFICAVFAIVLTWHRSPLHAEAAEAPNLIRTKGLIIEDSSGRARILLGAPFPTTPDRKRQDLTATSLLFLDEQGHDRISIGELMPAQMGGTVSPNFHRMGNAYSMTIFDTVGNERGGMGFLSNGAKVNRAAVVLDRPGGDAIGMYVDDATDSANLALMYSPRVSSSGTGLFISNREKGTSITLKDFHDIPRARFSVEGDLEPSFRMLNRDGQRGSELLSGAKRQAK